MYLCSIYIKSGKLLCGINDSVVHRRCTPFYRTPPIVFTSMLHL